MRAEVEYSCGHKEYKKIDCKLKELEGKLKWYKESVICPECKKKAELARTKEVEMLYREYKEKYCDCRTKENSYNKETKTIIVYVPNDYIVKPREMEKKRIPYGEYKFMQFQYIQVKDSYDPVTKTIEVYVK